MISRNYRASPAVQPSLELLSGQGIEWRFGTIQLARFRVGHGWSAQVHDFDEVDRASVARHQPACPKT